MNELCSPLEIVFIIVFFTVLMLLILKYFSRGDVSSEEYLVANRELGWKKAALSIAVSWIWAPAIFIASLQSYTKGIAGAFWFIAPNIVCFFVFSVIAVEIRKQIPNGYSFPDFIAEKYKNRFTHLAFLLIFLAYQLGSIVINSVAGGILLNQMSGISTLLATLIMPVVTILYALKTGMRASVITDVFQMLFIIVVALFLIPWLGISSGGIKSIELGLGGISGEYSWIFDSSIAYAFGIPMTIGLITGPLSDQMFFQRAYSVAEKDVTKTFVVGGILFGLVPVLLCIPGFIAAANPDIIVSNPEMVAPVVIAHFLPHWALLLFGGMALCGLCSTLDSSFCALSSLGAIDIYKRYFNNNPSREKLLKVSRNYMLFFTLLGTLIALLEPKLLWLSLIYGCIAGAGFFPLLFSVYMKDMQGNILAYAIIFSLSTTLPFSIYANIREDTDLIVYSSMFAVLSSLVIILTGRTLSKRK